MSAWFLYLIECQDGSIYTGITVDVAARYAAHASGKGARYTRSHPPKRLLASVEYPDRSSALKAEYEVKLLSADAKRAYADESGIRRTCARQHAEDFGKGVHPARARSN